MANKVEINVTAKDDASATLKKTESNVKSLAATVDSASASLKRGAGDADNYAGGLNRLEESGGTAETRFLGLGAGISGVNTLMQGGGPEDYAMAMADLGDSIEHTVAPALKSLGGGVTNLVGQLGGVQSAALATGAAIGAAGLVYALKQFNDAADEARGKALAEDFARTGEAAEIMTEALSGNDFALGDMANAFDALLEKSPALAQEFLDQAEAAGMDAEMVANAQAAIDEVAESASIAADEINGMNDALKAQFDPAFAAVDAANKLEEAQSAAAEAAAQYGADSQEAADASIAAAEAALNYDSSLLSLQAAVESGDVSISSMNATLRRWVSEGRITESQAHQVASAIAGVSGEARGVPKRTDTTLYAHDRARPTIRSVEGAVENLDGRSATIHVNVVLHDPSGVKMAALAGRRAHGGIIGSAAGGGIKSNMTLVGEQGPELVMMAPGSTVLTAGDTQTQMSKTGGFMAGGHNVIINVNGNLWVRSEREFVTAIRDAARKGAFRGVLASA